MHFSSNVLLIVCISSVKKSVVWRGSDLVGYYLNGVVQLPYLADLKRTIWCSLETDKKTSSRAQLGGRVPTARLISFEEGFHTNKIHDEQFSPWFHNSKSYPTFGYKVLVPHFDICKLYTNATIYPSENWVETFFCDL